MGELKNWGIEKLGEMEEIWGNGVIGNVGRLEKIGKMGKPRDGVIGGWIENEN